MSSKLMSQVTVAEILRTRPNWFQERQSDPAPSAQNLKYVAQLLDYGMNHIASAPFYAVFGDFDLAPLSVSAINKALASYAPAIKSRIPENAPVMTRLSLLAPSKLREALKLDTRAVAQRLDQERYNVVNMRQNITQIQRQIAQKQDEIEDMLRKILVHLDIVATLEAKVAAKTTGLDPERLAIIKNIPSQWLVVDISTEGFKVLNHEPIQMAYTSAAGAVSRTLNMGWIVMSFDWSLQCRGTNAVADFIDSGSNIHPHLSGSSICFGNTAHKAQDYQTRRDSKALFTLIHSLLTTYCPENPYLDFAYFERKRESGWTALAHLYTHTSGVDRSNVWFRENRTALLGVFRQHGSKALLSSPLFQAELLHEPEPDHNAIRDRGVKSMYEMWDAIVANATGRTKLTTILNREFNADGSKGETPIRGASGEELQALLKECGILIPDARFLVTHKIPDKGYTQTSLLWLMILAYGEVEMYTPPGQRRRFVGFEYDAKYSNPDTIKSYEAKTKYLLDNGQGVSARDNARYLRYYTLVHVTPNGVKGGRHLGQVDGSQVFHDNSSNLSMTTFVKGDDCITPVKRPMPMPTLTLPTETAPVAEWDEVIEIDSGDVDTDEDRGNEEENPCEDGHESFSSNGYCEYCDEYDADYDERLNDEDDD